MISHIDHLVTVSDIERAVAFYSGAFRWSPSPSARGAGRWVLWQPERSICSCWGRRATRHRWGPGISASSPRWPWIR